MEVGESMEEGKGGKRKELNCCVRETESEADVKMRRASKREEVAEVGEREGKVMEDEKI